jgi:hypothetical protein
LVAFFFPEKKSHSLWGDILQEHYYPQARNKEVSKLVLFFQFHRLSSLLIGTIVIVRVFVMVHRTDGPIKQTGSAGRASLRRLSRTVLLVFIHYEDSSVEVCMGIIVKHGLCRF